MRVLIDFSCLASFSFCPLAAAIDSSGKESASCHFAGQLSLSFLAHHYGSEERKTAVGSIDVNYADVTRVGASCCVLPLKESMKVKQLVSPLFFLLGDSVMSLWREKLHVHHKTNHRITFIESEQEP